MTRILTASLICAVEGYLLGSVSFSILISRLLKGEDIRHFGSKNAGMTNMLRTYGKKYALMCGIGDFSKGLLAVLLGRLVFMLFGLDSFDAGYISGALAIVGHMFPIFFGFHGGKGVLTGLGVLVALNPLVFLVVLVLVLPVLYFSRIVSLASVLGALFYPVATFCINAWWHRPMALEMSFALTLSVIVLYMHRQNIKRLLTGTEYRFPKRKP